MFVVLRLKRLVALILLLVSATVFCIISYYIDNDMYVSATDGDKKFIKWVDFNPTKAVLSDTLKLDIDSNGAYNWIELLAYLSAKYGGEFKRYKKSDLDALILRIDNGETVEVAACNFKNYKYFVEAYTAILGEYVGRYKLRKPDGEWQEKYGLKVYSPIAEGYSFSHFDDFGSGRSYGYKRKHLGHDLMTATGVPVVAVESGIVEELGWNQYGGWRIGIRSYDRKRYYYYAHLRKDSPYAQGMEIGRQLRAGDVIGYVGRTGYSATENTNNIEQSHLHFGVQLIFDESQKDGVNQIWINLYEITNLLQRNRSTVKRSENSKEFERVYEFEEEINNSIETSGDMDEIRVPIVMYHSILNNNPKNSAFIISPAQLEKDLKLLKENDFKTVVVDDLVKYVYEGGELPEKPVMLTFDDGHYNNVHYAQPLLESYGMRAVLSVVGEYSQKSGDEQNPNFSYVSWDTLAQVIERGVFEVQNHTYNLHSNTKGQAGAKRKRGEEVEAYKERLIEDLTKLQDKIYEISEYRPTAFTYPYGLISPESEQILQEMGFLATLSCANGVSKVRRGDTQSLFHLKRFLRANCVNLKSYLMG